MRTRRGRVLSAWLIATCLAACSEDAPAPAVDAAPADAPGADAADAPALPEDVPEAPSCFTDAGIPDAGAGRCAARVNESGLRRANEMDGDALVIPGGQRVRRAAARLALPGFPMALLAIPGTRRVVVIDGGIATQRLRVVDLSGAAPVVVPGGEQEFPRSGSSQEASTFYGLALTRDGRRLYVSGGGGNRVYVYDVAPSGALTPDLTRTLDLQRADPTITSAAQGYVSGLALSADDARLFVTYQNGAALSIRDTASGMQTGFVRFPPMDAYPAYPYAVVTRPGDARHVYVSLWGIRQVAEVDLDASAVSRTWTVGKNPEELLFSADGATLYVAASDSDAVAAVDLTTPMGTVQQHYLGGGATAPRGVSPTALAWAPDGRLYVTEANENAIAVFDVRAGFTQVGRIPTEWYPTDVEVLSDGTVVSLTGKGVGLGPNNDPSNVDILMLMAGSVATYAAPSDAELRAGDALASSYHEVTRSVSEVTCPDGADYDFPVPRPGMGASTKIRRVVFIVRENKTYDALMGDMPEGRGEPRFTIVPRERMDRTFPNFRALARAFSAGDNFYSGAEQSLQGHVWTSQGRTTDFTERAWLTTWGRDQRGTPPIGTTEIGIPEEGTIFDAMGAAMVRTENWGEPVARARFSVPLQRYGSIPQDLSFPEIRRARNFVDWTVDNCRLATFTYIVLPNDHTAGGRAGFPTPTSMYQDNDEATGLIVDALSHSTFWPETLVVLIEDDPQDGGDSVDNHRSVVLMASPWVRRRYMSHGHYDNASLHHTIEAILGVPAHNRTVADAGVMYDFFTSTPDFTPYTYTPRLDPPAMNPAVGMYAEESARMDWSTVDNQPGLSRLVWRMTHGGRAPPWRGVQELDLDGDGD